MKTSVTTTMGPHRHQGTEVSLGARGGGGLMLRLAREGGWVETRRHRLVMTTGIRDGELRHIPPLNISVPEGETNQILRGGAKVGSSGRDLRTSR